MIVREFDREWGELVDVDLLATGEWAGLFSAGDRLLVRMGDRCVEAPSRPKSPIVRCLDPDRCVLVEPRTEQGRRNAWILSLSPPTVREFMVGDGVQDVLASSGVIVATYFDEGVFSGIAPSDEGVAVFDGSGQLRAGYRASLGAAAVDVGDCYAACWASENVLAFLPYPDFPLVKLDLGSLRQSILETPAILHGASAITSLGEVTFFFGPYAEPKGVFAWSPGGEPIRLGRYPAPLRGLGGGRFLSLGTRGFTVVNCGSVAP